MATREEDFDRIVSGNFGFKKHNPEIETDQFIPLIYPWDDRKIFNMFLFKKIVAPQFFPVPLCLEILLLGLFSLWFTKKQKAGKIIVSIGVGSIIIFSFGTIQDILLQSLENKYLSLISFQEVDDVRWIVVLGGENTSDPKLPVNDQISTSSLARLVEGIRIHKK